MGAVLLAWVAGVGLQLQQAALWPGWAYAGGVAASAALGLAGWRLKRRFALALAALVLGFALAGWCADVQLAQRLPPELDNRTLTLIGRVAGLPQRLETGSRFLFEVESARLDGELAVIGAPVLMGWYAAPGGALPTLVPGERWRLDARLRAPHGPLNPQGFDRELWLWQQGVAATGTVRGAAERLDGPGWHAPVARARHAVADALRGQVADPRAAGVLVALVVGDQSAIERGDWDLFRLTGVAHLMAISGLHVTLFAWLAMAVVAACWRLSARWTPAWLLRWPASHAGAAGGLLLAVAYAVFSGWGVPAQRTVLMLAVVVALRLRGLHWPWPLVWLWAMAAVVLLDPWALLQAGFWLSFVAVGVLFASAGSGAPRGGRLGALLREQAVVTVALAPLTLLLFGQVSVVGLLANLVAIPWVTLLVTPLALLGVLFAPLWVLAAWAVSGLAAGLELLAAWPWAVWHQAVAPWPLALAAVAGGVLLVMRLPWALRLQGLVLLWPSLTYQPPRPPPGGFELLVPDVGQGGAVLLRTARHSLLYDAGPAFFGGGDAGERVLVPLLRRQGERLDLLLVSHQDADHAGGTEAVLASQPGAAFLSSFDPAPGSLAARRPGLPGLGRRCAAGQRWNWDGVDFELLHPAADSQGSDNARSCVLKVGNGRQSVLLAGDIGAQEELRLALSHPRMKTDLLLAPHHGSASSSSPAWLNTLMPRWVVIQSGHHNRFGHPAPVVLQRYAQRGARWRTSPACGAAHWSSQMPDAVACERENGRRYWHARVPEAHP